MVVNAMILKTLRAACAGDRATFNKLHRGLVSEDEARMRDIFKGLAPDDYLIVPITKELRLAQRKASKKTR